MKYSRFISNLFIVILFSCSQQDEMHYTEPAPLESINQIDTYIKEKLTDPYHCRVVYDWQQPRYMHDFKLALTPPRREVVIPAVNMILTYFVNPIKKSTNGEAFIKQLFPREFVFAGSAAHRIADGMAYAGLAEAGVNIMLTNLNAYNPKDKKFIREQAHTIHHEFTHIVNQNTTEGVPEAYKKVNPAYNGESWVNIKLKDAIKSGFVSSYGSRNPDEDFAEMISTYLTRSDAWFNRDYMPNPEEEEKNPGKEYIAKKLEIAKDYYQSHYEVDLEEIKANVQKALAQL